MNETDENSEQGAGSAASLSVIAKRSVSAAVQIAESDPDTVDYLHSTFCQLGIPRSKTDRRVYEHRIGNASVRITAGSLYNGEEWVPQPLPYGTRPRLILVYLTTQAVLTESPVIDVGDNLGEFMARMGLSDTGGKRGNYRSVRAQLNALAASQIQLGFIHGGRAVTSAAANAIENSMIAFEPAAGEKQRSLWTSTITLRREFYETIATHSVPFDPRAIAALKDSALAMDLYWFQVYRQPKIPTKEPLLLTWSKLWEQFGDGYGNIKDFKKAFRIALRRSSAQYPRGKLESVPGGIKFFHSPPAVPPSVKPRPLLSGRPGAELKRALSLNRPPDVDSK